MENCAVAAMMRYRIALPLMLGLLLCAPAVAKQTHSNRAMIVSAARPLAVQAGKRSINAAICLTCFFECARALRAASSSLN
jgi:hypothetical protein